MKNNKMENLKQIDDSTGQLIGNLAGMDNQQTQALSTREVII